MKSPGKDVSTPNKRDRSRSRSRSVSPSKKIKVDYDAMSFGELFQSFKEEVKKVADRVDDKFENMEKRISKNVVDAVSKDIANKIKSSVEKAVAEKLGTIKDEIKEDIAALQLDVDNLKEENEDDEKSRAKKLNFVIYNLEEGKNENLENKVNAMIREGMKVRDVTIRRCERKNAREGTDPGIVIAQC